MKVLIGPRAGYVSFVSRNICDSANFPLNRSVPRFRVARKFAGLFLGNTRDLSSGIFGRDSERRIASGKQFRWRGQYAYPRLDATLVAEMQFRRSVQHHVRVEIALRCFSFPRPPRDDPAPAKRCYVSRDKCIDNEEDISPVMFSVLAAIRLSIIVEMRNAFKEETGNARKLVISRVNAGVIYNEE